MDQSIKKISSKDGTKISYATSGSGPAIVKTANYITHLEHDWNNAVWKPFLENFCRHHTLIRYDERGCGLSDWYTRDYSFETWVQDLEAVVNSENLETFFLFGQSQGSTVAIAYAARHPEKIKKLILFGGYARGWLHRDLNEKEKQVEQLLIDMIKLGWGKDNPAFRDFFSSQIMPGASQEKINAFNEMMKISTEPEVAALLEREMHLTNVVEEAPLVKCPTLILHSNEDASIPFLEGKILNDLIPGSRLVRLESNNHIIQENEPAWSVFWDEVYRFLEVDKDFSTSTKTKQKKPERMLRTILFTDIADSTKMALELGDENWIQTLENHNQIVRESIAQFYGTEIKATGDGFLLMFDSPTLALECARDLIQQFEQTPINIRCGIHTGEIERTASDIRGINIHLAARLMSVAGVNEIWTTTVVKELSLGSDISFESKGFHELKGFEEKKELFKVI